MKKILLITFFFSFFLLLGTTKFSKAAFAGECGSLLGQVGFGNSCTVSGQSCTTDTQCCSGVCIPPQHEITTDAQCNGDSACLQALAYIRQNYLGPGGDHSVHKIGNSYAVVCDNGSVLAIFKDTVTPTPTLSPTPTPVLACGSPCAKPADCQGVQNGCTACTGGVCKIPATPTPTIPACGSPCAKPADCQGALNGCTACIGGQCKIQPSPTPTIPACGSPCAKPADCQGALNGCNACIGGMCKVQPTPTPVLACGSPCNLPADCQNAINGCTACTGGVCKVPAACGTPCNVPADCQGALNGCNACIGGMCKIQPSPTPALACGSPCTKPTDCQNALNGCTACTGGVCKVPAACGTPCNVPADCQGALNGCNACIGGMCKVQPTPTPALTCGSPCAKPADCQNAINGCTACTGGVCKVPAACGIPCTNPADCQNAIGGCTACTGGVCKVPAACGTPCTVPTDCQGALNGCNACIGGMCKVQPTPTPVFNPASCTCDGIDNTDLFSGQPSTITAYAKVIGADVNNAKVVDQKFYLAEGAETIATIIAQSSPIPASIVSSSSTMVRYQSQWNLTLPNLKPGATYRLWSQINCQPKTMAMNYSSRRVVLAQQTQQPSLLDTIMQFFSNLFHGTNTTQAKPTVPTVTPASPSNGSKKTLQLDTLHPVQVYQKTCTFIKFRVVPMQ